MQINRDYLLGAGAPCKPGRAMTPRYITIHDSGNPSPTADALAHAKYLKNLKETKSWHYSVDDKDVIYQHLEDTEQGWHAGDGKGTGNTASIGIELCVCKGYDEKKLWRNGAALTRELMRRHNIPLERVVPHHHWSGKNCPASFLPRFDEFLALVAGTDAPAEKQADVARLLRVRTPMLRGSDVLWLQKALLQRGYAPGAADAIFGPRTERAVRAFQKDAGLAVDGIAGRHTVTALGGVWGG